LSFLINEQRKLPNNFPSYKDAPVLWKDLKREADFFGLEGMKLILREQAFIHSCSPDLGDKDILYWLGTRQGKADYQNPFEIGAVNVGGCSDTFNLLNHDNLQGSSKEARAGFVEHKPQVLPVQNLQGTEVFQDTLYLSVRDEKRISVEVDFRRLLVSPTHFSLRGMNGKIPANYLWNFEGSVDGEEWDVLHENTVLRGRKTTRRTVLASGLEVFPDEEIGDYVTRRYFDDAQRKIEVFTDFREEFFRKTWNIEVSDVERRYRYFRFIPIGASVEKNAWLDEALGIAFQIYGTVFDEN
jgi:hypothetical protein